METERRSPPGRFTILLSPTLLALSFILLATLCDRQNRRMDIRVIHPALAGRLETAFGSAAQFSAFAAGAVALWLALRRFRSVEDAIAAILNTITFAFGLAFWTMVVC